MFEALKKALINILILVYYLPKREIILETDTSDKVISGILS
jgi:hypothetical protein